MARSLSIPLRQFFFVIGQHANLQSVGPDSAAGIEDARAHEDAGHRVVVGSRDGVGFMVMAASTGNGQSEKLPCDNVDLVVGYFALQSILVGLLIVVVTHAEKTGRDQAVAVDVAAVGVE